MVDERQYAAKCPHCSTRLRVRRQDLGSRRTCPKCKQVFSLPKPSPEQVDEAGGTISNQGSTSPTDDWQPPLEVPVVCRVCQTRFYAREDQIGQKLACPDCDADNQVYPAPKPKSRGTEESAEIRLTGTSDRQMPGDEPDQFRVVCRVCETMHYCLPKQVGEKVRCSDCGSIFTVPHAPPKKAKPKIRVPNPGINVRPAAETSVYKSNADALLAKASAKYHEQERLKPIPPKRPFSESVWSLPFQLEVLPLFLGVSLLACLVLFLASVALQMQGREMVIGMVLMAAAGGLSILTYVTITNALMAVTISSSMGLTKIDFPKFEMFACFMVGVLLFTSSSFSFGPGVTLALLTGVPWVAIVALPFGFFVFPFVFLSMLDADSAAVPYTPHMASTFNTNRSDWIRFYLVASPAFLLVTLPHGAALWFQLSAEQADRETPIQLAAFFAAICVSTFGVLVYFRLLGRLAWVIDLTSTADAEVDGDADSHE